MSKLVDATTPAIISKMNEYGKILGINTKAAREFAEALSQSNIKGTEQQLSELEKRRDQLITDIAKQSQLYNKGLVEVVAGMAGEIYTRPASEKEEKAAFENLQKMQKS